MKILDVQQRSDAWHEARLGIPTASRFGELVTSKGKLSSSDRTRKYCCELLVERMLGMPADTGQTPWMDRGEDLELSALRYYELTHGDVTPVGLVMLDDESAACSPDGLVGTDGGLEIKCRSAKLHVYNQLFDDDSATVQIQGCMYICERHWWDVLHYHPVLPSFVKRFERDAGCIAVLAMALDDFKAVMQEQWSAMPSDWRAVADRMNRLRAMADDANPDEPDLEAKRAEYLDAVRTA